jgi:hypothetical protein
MLGANQPVEQYVLITCSTTLAGKSGPKAWSEIIVIHVEINIHRWSK